MTANIDYHALRLQVIAVRLSLGYKLTQEQENDWSKSSEEEQKLAFKTINKNRSN